MLQWLHNRRNQVNGMNRIRTFLNQKKVTETYITDELCKMQEEKELGKRSIGFSD